MDLNGRLPIVITAIFVIAAALAVMLSTSFVISGLQSKVAAQASNEESLGDKMAPASARAVRVIVASPYRP